MYIRPPKLPKRSMTYARKTVISLNVYPAPSGPGTEGKARRISIASTSQLPQVSQQRFNLLGLRLPVEVDAVGGRHGWHRARRRTGTHALEELDIVLDHFLQRRRTVVVEVRRGVADASQTIHVQLVPVIERRRPSDKPGQQRAPRIGTDATHSSAVRQGDFICTRVAR